MFGWIASGNDMSNISIRHMCFPIYSTLLLKALNVLELVWFGMGGEWQAILLSIFAAIAVSGFTSLWYGKGSGRENDWATWRGGF